MLDLANAAEPTAAEQMSERLEEAETHADRLLGERWNRLVRQRQWTDKSGKFKTYARYVDHDPDLQSVTLLILVKKDGTSSYKEATIPLVKLSKNDQAVVKRIAAMRADVEEALADAPALDGVAAGEAANIEGAPFDESRIMTETTAEVPPPPAHLAALATVEPWRTDFAAFTSNLTAQQDEQGQWTVSWSALPQFDAVYQQERLIHQLKNGPAGFPAAAFAADPPQLGEGPPRADIESSGAPQQQPAEAQVIQPPPATASVGVPRSTLFMLGAQYGWARSGLGEVSWETTVHAAPEAGQPLEHDLQLPSPLALELVPDSTAARDFARLKPGERIRFVARFERLGGFDDPPKIVLKIRPVSDSDGAGVTERSRELYGRSSSP